MGLGNDTLVGDKGADRLTCGEGSDRFVFGRLSGNPATHSDRITDFTQGSDLINLVRIDPHLLAGGLHGLEFIGDAGFGGTTAELRFAAVGGETRVEADINGDGVADFAVILTGRYTLTAADFAL